MAGRARTYGSCEEDALFLARTTGAFGFVLEALEGGEDR